MFHALAVSVWAAKDEKWIKNSALQQGLQAQQETSQWQPGNMDQWQPDDNQWPSDSSNQWGGESWKRLVKRDLRKLHLTKRQAEDFQKSPEDALKDVDGMIDDSFNGLEGLLNGKGQMSEDMGKKLVDQMVKAKLSWSWGLAIVAALLELLAIVPIVISQRREDEDKTAFNMSS